MKYAFLSFALFFITSVNAQNESRTEKKFQRFENGELIEDKYYMEENGRVVEGNDFDLPEMNQMQHDMDSKMAEMQLRMNEMQQNSNEMMRTRMQDMDRRMEEMKQRSIQMQNEMELNRNKSGSPEPSQAPSINPPSSNGSIGTTYNS